MGFDGASRRTAGLGGVLVHPDQRDQGTARTVISVAVDHARAAGAETMVLLCRPDVVPFCTQPGWSRVSAPVAFRRPHGTRTLPVTTMIYGLAGRPHPTVSADLWDQSTRVPP